MAMEKENWFGALRSLAKKTIADNKNKGKIPLEESDIASLVHEFEVYQAELEIQNEELRNTQTELIQSRNRFSALFQNAPAGYVVLSEDGLVLEANRTVSNMLQRERGKLLNKPFFPYIDPTDRGVFLGRFRSLYKNPEGKFVEVRMFRHDGSSFHARMGGNTPPSSMTRRKIHRKINSAF